MAMLFRFVALFVSLIQKASLFQWFLQFDPKLKGHYHTADCDHNFEPPKCSRYYHDQTNTPQMDVPHNVTPFGPHAKGPPRGYPCIEPCDCGVQPCGECE